MLVLFEKLGRSELTVSAFCPHATEQHANRIAIRTPNFIALENSGIFGPSILKLHAGSHSGVFKPCHNPSRILMYAGGVSASLWRAHEAMD
jgi:hypothetical protein